MSRGAWLWAGAVVLMLGAASYQRMTGPTKPVTGALTVQGETVSYRLPRTHETVADARVAIPAPGAASSGWVEYRRFPTDEPFTRLDLVREADDDGTDELAAYLPVQPAAGKLEYRVVVQDEGARVTVPSVEEAAQGRGTIVMRYKDPVPLPVLLSHVLFMFTGMLVGMRAGLGAIFGSGGLRRLSWTTLGLLTVGGLGLGPLVQKFAFDAYWTGFPWGYDLTDNKTLIMWLSWAGACAAVGFGKRAAGYGRVQRAVVVAAAVITTGVYLVPHSLRGSELDYGLVDEGVDPTEAVGTGS